VYSRSLVFRKRKEIHKGARVAWFHAPLFTRRRRVILRATTSTFGVGLESVCEIAFHVEPRNLGLLLLVQDDVSRIVETPASKVNILFTEKVVVVHGTTAVITSPGTTVSVRVYAVWSTGQDFDAVPVLVPWLEVIQLLWKRVQNALQHALVATLHERDNLEQLVWAKVWR
jgi:hypothetical protein